MWFRLLAASALTVAASAASALTLTPIEFGQLEYVTVHDALGTRDRFDRYAAALGEAALGTIHEYGPADYRYAAYAVFQLPDVTGFTGAQLTATVGKGTVSMWDMSTPTYDDATGGVQYGSMRSGSAVRFPGVEVSTFLTAAALADLFAHSGGTFLVGFAADEISLVRNVSLTMTPILANPLPASVVLFASGLLGLLGFSKVRRSCLISSANRPATRIN